MMNTLMYDLFNEIFKTGNWGVTWAALKTQYSAWPQRVSWCMNFLWPTLGEGRARRRKQSSDTALSTTWFVKSLRWSFANARMVSNSLMLKAVIFLAMMSWSYDGSTYMAWRSFCERREDKKKRNSGFGIEQKGNKAFYNSECKLFNYSSQ